MPNHENFTEIRQRAEEAIRRAEKRASNYYGLNLPEAALDFSLRGRCAGQARISRNGRISLRINLQLLAENLEDFLKQTIPHEVAHLVVYWQTRNQRLRPQPHGPEWQAVMRDCFGLAASRCHNYPTTPARVVPRPFLYTCNCREHHLTSVMHKRISRCGQALCKACRTALTFVASQTT